MATDAVPVETVGTGGVGEFLPRIEAGKIVDQRQDAFGQRPVAVEQTDAASVLQRHVRQGDPHRQNRQAIEHVVQAFELEAAQQVGHQRQARTAHIRVDIGHATDEVDRREAPAEIGEVAGLGLAHELKLDACSREDAGAGLEERLHADALGRPVETANQDGAPRYGRVDRARGDPWSAIARRQEHDRPAGRVRCETPAIV